MTESNKLKPSAFSTYREFQVTPFRSQDIKDWLYLNSEEIELEKMISAETPAIVGSSALTYLPIPRDSEIGGFLFKSILLVRLKRTQQEVLAETWLEDVYEYGAGQDDTEAITDLVVSLGEYLHVLNKRKKQLGDSACKELEALRRLIKRQKPSASGG